MPDTGDVPVPEHLAPMLAVLGELPRDQAAGAFELKWDGVRAVAFWDGARLRLQTRNLRDVTVAYPELAPLGPTLGAVPTVLDGEIVALDHRGVPSFQRLQERMHVADARTAAARAERTPVAYFAFDLLHRGRPTLHLPWERRREALEALAVAGPAWATPPAFVGDGEGDATWAAAVSGGFEGVVAKRLDSPYLPGARSPAWTKVKIVARDEFVVGGWLPGEGGRSGRIGALLLGVPSGEGRLRFVGAVGTGFTGTELARLGAQLEPLARPTSPFTEPLPRRDARFVAPQVVVDVEYRQITDAGILRQASYKGVRIDKTPADVNTGAWVDQADRRPGST